MTPVHRCSSQTGRLLAPHRVISAGLVAPPGRRPGSYDSSTSRPVDPHRGSIFLSLTPPGPFTGVRPVRICAGYEGWRTLANVVSIVGKRVGGQPLRSSNLLSSATMTRSNLSNAEDEATVRALAGLSWAIAGRPTLAHTRGA